jgi:hypothetical protein
MIENSEKFKKSKKLDRLISDSLPFMPYLLQDLWAFGTELASTLWVIRKREG